MNAQQIVRRLLDGLDDPSSDFLEKFQTRRNAVRDWCNFYSPKVHWQMGSSDLMLLNQPFDNGMAKKLVNKLIADKLVRPEQVHWYPREIRCDIQFEPDELDAPVRAD